MKNVIVAVGYDFLKLRFRWTQLRNIKLFRSGARAIFNKILPDLNLPHVAHNCTKKMLENDLS